MKGGTFFPFLPAREREGRASRRWEREGPLPRYAALISMKSTRKAS
jgi:hypothetical protein